mgnify:CR=1 FL=1
MVERFATHTCGCDKHAQIFQNLILTRKILKSHRSQSLFHILVAANTLLSYVKFFFHHI